MTPLIAEPFFNGTSSTKLNFILGEEAFSHGGQEGFNFEKHVKTFIKYVFSVTLF